MNNLLYLVNKFSYSQVGGKCREFTLIKHTVASLETG